MDLHSIFVETAQKHGVPLASSVDLELALLDPNQSFNEQVKKFKTWINAGYAGSMDYLVRGQDRRSDPSLLFPGTQSILTVAIPYSAKPTQLGEGPKYARYLRGPDYHLQIASLLETIMQEVALKFISSSTFRWKVCVDTSAVLERTWATLSGLGWIGKNTLLMNPQWGSYLFLGEVLVTARTFQPPKPMKSFCGNCRRCLDGCPTQAFPEPRVLDSRKCISFWTLEKRGELDLIPEKKKQMGSWIAGCDICQEVCPFNFKRSRSEESLPDLLEGQGAIYLKEWLDLLRETPEEYKMRVKHSALKRVKPGQFSRNLANALSHFLDELKMRGDTRTLEELHPQVVRRVYIEEDEFALKEWNHCLSHFNQ